MTDSHIDQIAAHHICSDCIGDTYLKSRMISEQLVGRCHYCGKENVGSTLEELSYAVRHAIENHFRRTGYPYLKEADEGQPVEEVISRILSASRAVSRNLRMLLEENSAPSTSDFDVGNQFDENARYVATKVRDEQLYAEWGYLEESLKSQARFFNSVARKTLDGLFNDLGSYQTAEGNSVVREIGPQKGVPFLYRARVFQNPQLLSEAIIRPDLHIAAPPARTAGAGRMNARGIAVFYGATTEHTAVAEVRPPVGSYVVTAKFDVLRVLKILDVQALKSLAVKGSIFDPDYTRDLKRAVFFERLSRRITQPVLPDDEPFDYLVTQAIAEYLSNVVEPPLDGIMFDSVQGSDQGVNVALFHKAARVESISVPSDTKIETSSLGFRDGRLVPKYVVREIVPDTNENEKHDGPFDGSSEIGLDNRIVTLKVDLNRVVVQLVDGVIYRFIAHDVERKRITQAQARAELSFDFE